MRPWALVTPASRGIGLALTRHLLKNTSIPIVATGRKKLDELKQQVFEGIDDVDESRLHVHEVDVLGMRSTCLLPMPHTRKTVLTSSSGR